MLDTLLKNLDITELSGQLASLGVPAEKTGDALELAKGSIADTFKSQATGGDLGGMLDLFNGKQNIGSSSLVGDLIGNYAGQLAGKLGISPDIAKSVSQMLIPTLLSSIDNNTPSSGLTDEMLKGVLGGSSASGLGDTLRGFFN